MTTESCAYCGRPLPAGVGEHIGPVKFCGRAHIADWFSLPTHDRRTTTRPVQMERRAS